MSSRLASLLVQEGLCAPKQIADAFQRQVIYGGTLDTILLEMNAVPETSLVGALARATSLPAGDTPSIDKLRAADALTWFPAALAEKYRAVPFAVEGATVRVLTLDPPDRKALDELGRELNRPVEPAIVPEHRFVHALAMVYDTPVPARFQSLQARLLRRAQQVPQASAPAAAPLPAPAPTPAPAAVVTDLPMPGAPASPHDAMLTPRLPPREPEAPAPVSRELAGPTVASADATPLGADAAVGAIDQANDRDDIFGALCRAARARADYSALFTVHADTLVGRIALGDAWIDRARLSSISMSLDAPTPLRAAVVGRSPLMGRLGDEEASRTLLGKLGRTSPTLAALVPIVLRDRTVALLYADADGRPLATEAMGELSNVAGAAARAFQRLILQAKGASYGAAGSGVAAKVQTDASQAKVGALSAVAKTAGGWHAGASEAGARLGSAAPASSNGAEADLIALFESVERGDDEARGAADRLVAAGPRAAELAVARLPGPIRIDRNNPYGLTAPLGDHGPLCALLARFGPSAVPALRGRVADPSAEVRFYIALALAELGGVEAIPAVAGLLFDRDVAVRKAAADSLVRLGESPARNNVVESLRGELPGPERERQRMAAEALGALGDVASVPRLVELVKHDDNMVQSAARRALVAITKQDFGTSRWRWRGWWDRHKNEDRAEWLFEGLGHAEDDIRRSSAEELRRMFSESFNFHWDAPKRDREDARKRWHDWYRQKK